MKRPTTPSRLNGPDTELDEFDPHVHAVAYERVSTKDQAAKGGEPDGFSLPAQRAAIEARAASGFRARIRRHFVDKGESARTADRDGLQDLLKYLQENRVDYVFVHKLDRLARNRFDDVEITMAIRKSGARLVSVTENIDETPSGMLMHGIMSSIAEFYSRNLAQEVQKGLAQKAKSGGTPGRAPLGYLNRREVTPTGHEIRTVSVDPERAPLVRTAFELYATGEYSLERLSAAMGEQGLTSRPTPKRPAKPISKTQLLALLNNPYYAGRVRYMGEEYDGQHEALISPQMFERVQAVIEHRSRGGSRDIVHRPVLKGLVYCDRCFRDGRLSRLVFSVNQGRNGTLYPYYKCLGRQRREGCDLPYLPEDQVERAVGDELQRQTFNTAFVTALEEELDGAIADEQRLSADLRRNLARQLKELDQQEERLLDLALDDSMPTERIKVRLSELRTKRDAINQELDTQDASLAVGLLVVRSAARTMTNVGDLYFAGDGEVRRQVSQSVFRRLFIDERGDVTHGDVSDVIEELVHVRRRTSNKETSLLPLAPEGVGGSREALVAGAGFEPATSGL